MADNYTLFSEVVPALNAKEHTWALRLLRASGDGAANSLAAAGIDLDLQEDPWPAFQWELGPQRSPDLWLYSHECGNLDHVTRFVQALLRRFRRQDYWTLTWAETCSRPRSGEFGGGGGGGDCRRGAFFHCSSVGGGAGGSTVPHQAPATRKLRGCRSGDDRVSAADAAGGNGTGRYDAGLNARSLIAMAPGGCWRPAHRSECVRGLTLRAEVSKSPWPRPRRVSIAPRSAGAHL